MITMDDENRASYDEQFVDYSNYYNPPIQPPEPAYLPPLPPTEPAPTAGLKIVTAILVFVALIGCGFIVGNIKLVQQPLSSEVAAVEVYNMKDRPYYDEMVNLINRLYDKYTRQDLTGEIWQRFDRETEDYNYVIDYLSELNYYHKKLAIYETQQSSNPSELDYEIEYTIADLDELERKFIAKAPITTTITITLEDGTQLAVAKKTKTSIRYGATVGVEDIEQDSPLVANAPLDEEAWARGFEGATGSDGTYLAAARQLAERFDMYLDYNWANILNKCIGSSAGETEVLAAYCHATPDVIYVNKNAVNYNNNIRHSMFISTIKHEISHHIIATICGTAQPPIAGALVEGVTNSYANIFLGAHEKNEYYTNHPEYQMSETTNTIARAIHDEKRCSR
jgi:hypothetical protein